METEKGGLDRSKETQGIGLPDRLVDEGGEGSSSFRLEFSDVLQH